ncbi:MULTISPECIES: helix-turn-helix transcriptional regulator [Paenibacillus]|uniref:helix-turn-helix transcriptional regulator n=1 Tax=Paenibacillus TaxID=44249 RepID=UPI0022B9194D|nr:YafY family protein [Paenibacillus caseinilyticus]MCZ8520842.1 YafY family protein [Paenibacillus caseinilyticus]
MMNKAQRLLQLFMTIQTKHKFNLADLTEEFQVSKRTMLRDLQELSELGVPLYSELGVHGGYRLLRDRMLPPIHFTDKEALALFLIAESLRDYKMLPFDSEVESALKKFYHYSPPETKEKLDRIRSNMLFHVPARQLETPHLSALFEASLDRRVVHITYESERGVSNRDIQAIGIYAMNGFWYCPAYCCKSQDYRLFRVDRVTSLTEAEDPTSRIDMIGYQIKDWVFFDRTEETADLTIKLTRAGVIRSQSDPWMLEGLTVQEDGTGLIRRKVTSSYLPCLVDVLIGYGKDAVVEEPRVCREMILNRVDEIRELYSAKI